MKLSRREFIKGISSASLILLGGGIERLSPAAAAAMRKGVSLRFVVASDGHFGQSDTEFNLFHDTFINNITAFHKTNPLDFCVINGDVIHNEKNFLAQAKVFYDKLPMSYYVTKGNHDMVSDAYWKEVWGMDVNHEVTKGNNTIVLATTSNEQGDYLSPDLDWLKIKLEANRKAKNIFIFIHIPQAKWTKNAIETPAFFELIKQQKNVRGVFHGHEHDQDGIKMIESVPYLFDSHIGGNWGTSYKGFRVVELTKDNSILTYIMNPIEKINQASL